MPKKDFNLILCIDENFDSPGKATAFSALHANSHYYQVDVEKIDLAKSVFDYHHGLNRFVRMLFVLKNATETLQRAMHVTQSPVKKSLL